MPESTDASPPSDEPGDRGGALPDLEKIFREAFGADVALPPELSAMFSALRADPTGSTAAAMVQQQFRAVFGSSDPGARLASATDTARKVVSSAGDPSVGPTERREVEQAVAVARLWLDPVTTLDAPAGPALAWSGAEWVESTMPRWAALVGPISEGVAAASTDAMRRQLGRLGSLPSLSEIAEIPELAGLAELAGLTGPGGEAPSIDGLLAKLVPALEGLSAGMFSAQLGQAVGALAGDVLSGTEVGLPLVDVGAVALLPARVAELAQGLAIEPGQVRLYLAVREAARVRLFAQVPWLAAQLEASVRDYGRHITIDTEAIEQAVQSVDLSDLAAVQQAFSQAELFGRATTPLQDAALARLETTLALVEGWVDLVTEQAVAATLPQASALGEAMRRRRAGGPAQRAFAGLVGIELRPRRLRDARNLWAALQDAGGIELRDESWTYPDLAPTGADLDDPLGYVERRQRPASPDAMDLELDRLLSGEDPGGS